MSLGLRKTSRKHSHRDSAAHEINPGRLGFSSTVPRHLSVGTKALEALISARDLIGLAIDSTGIVRAVGASDSQAIKPLCDALVGQFLDALFGRNTYKLLFDALVHPRSPQMLGDLDSSVGTNSSPRWFAVLIRSFPQRGEGKKLFSMFGCNIVASSSSGKKLDTPEKSHSNVDRLTEVATWQADLQAGELVVSSKLLTELGLSAAASLHVSEVLLEIVRSCRLAPQAETLESSDSDFHHNSDGTGHLLQGEVIPLPCSAEPPLRFVAALADTTQLSAVERNLRESECLLAQAEQIANLGSWDFDINTRKVNWSEQLYKLFGFCPWQQAAEEIYWDNLHPADRVRVREITDQAIRESNDFSYVARYRLPTGEYRVHYTRGVPIRGADGKTARMIGVVQDITERAQVEADLHRLSSELMRARDEERRHMARELHESAGQSLAALKMTLGNLREALPKKNSLANSLLQTCLNLTNEAVKEVRTISYLMHPPMLDEAGLPSAVRWYARGFADRSKIQVDVDVPDNFGRQPQEIEMTVFRIIQESLTNVHRYSGSKTAQIRLERNATEIRAEIRDRGCGLAHPMNGNGNGQPLGVGIAGMRERIHQLNGVFEIDSIPGQGTVVTVVLPVAPGAPAEAAQKLLGHVDEPEDRRLQSLELAKAQGES